MQRLRGTCRANKTKPPMERDRGASLTEHTQPQSNARFGGTSVTQLPVPGLAVAAQTPTCCPCPARHSSTRAPNYHFLLLAVVIAALRAPIAVLVVEKQSEGACRKFRLRSEYRYHICTRNVRIVRFPVLWSACAQCVTRAQVGNPRTLSIVEVMAAWGRRKAETKVFLNVYDLSPSNEYLHRELCVPRSAVTPQPSRRLCNRPLTVSVTVWMLMRAGRTGVGFVS